MENLIDYVGPTIFDDCIDAWVHLVYPTGDGSYTMNWTRHLHSILPGLSLFIEFHVDGDGTNEMFTMQIILDENVLDEESLPWPTLAYAKNWVLRSLNSYFQRVLWRIESVLESEST